MRTCETCRYEDVSRRHRTRCGKCGPDRISWELKLEAQLAAKDAVIEGLVETSEKLIVAMCAQSCGVAPCPSGEKECDEIRAVHAAIAVAKEE